jgi:hypothetical protein
MFLFIHTKKKMGKGGEHTARTIKDCDSDIMKQKKIE